MDHWQAYTSTEGRTYYHNQQTGETSWNLPGSNATPAPNVGAENIIPDTFKACLTNYVRPQRGWLFVPWGTGSSLSSDAPAPRTQTDSHVPDPESVLNSENWLEIKPEEGATYFWNPRVGISAKRLPQGVQCSWSLHHSAEGKPYFHNRSSGSTVWDLPSFPQGERGASSCKWVLFGAALSVAGLQKDYRYNKQVAQVIGFQDGRVLCQLPDELGAAVLRLSPDNLQPLERGTIVEFQGLSKTTLNGEVGTVEDPVAGDNPECRYQVKMRDGAVKSAKSTNLRPRCRLWKLDLKNSPSELQWGADKQYLFIDSQGHHRKYCLRLPLDFERKQQEAQRGHEVAPTWPLLVFMHGAGGRPFFERAKWMLSSEGWQFVASRFAVLSPLCDWGWADEPKPWVVELIQQVRVVSIIDHRRVYLTGHSMGGMGAWEVAAQCPELFAAVAPVAAYHKETRTDYIANRLMHMPICAVYSIADTTCPVHGEEPLWHKLKAASAKLRVQIAPDLCHGSMFERAYCDDATLYEWLLRFVSGA